LNVEFLSVSGMLARLCALLLSGLLAFEALVVGGSQALTQAVDVVVLVDRFTAEYGDTINVTVHVFDRGALADPSQISAVIDKLPWLSPFALSRQSVGVFRGAFVFESHPTIVRVNATVGTTQDSGAVVVRHRFDQVWVVPSAGTARPGETVTVTVETHDGDGALRDADSVNITAEVLYVPEYGRRSPPTALSPTRTAVGRYSAGFTVPKDVDRNVVVEFRGVAVRGRSGSGFGASVYVNFPDFFQVWYRPLGIGGTNVTLEIDVASLTGAPVPNANVSFRMWPVQGYAIRDFQGTTNRSGAVRFDIPVQGIVLGFYGNATFASQRQAFSGEVSLFPPSTPGEPELVRENPGEFFQIGETAVLRFHLSKGGSPVSYQDLFVYAHTTSDVILAERIRTDSTGGFELRFTVPSSYVTIDIGADIPGTWKALHTSFSAVNRFPVIVSSPDGWHLLVSGRFPGNPELWVASLGLSTKGQAPAGSWTGTGSFGPTRIVSGFGDEPFAFNVSLPRFLPAGQEVTLSIWAESFRGEFSAFRLNVITGTPIVRQTDLSVLVPILGLGIVIAIVASGLRLKRNRGRRIARRRG
jgi:hypothetical protein